MAKDKGEGSKKRRRFGFIPRYSRPRMNLRGGLRVDEQFDALRDGMRVNHTCPHDGAPMQLQDVFQADDRGEIPEGAEPIRALVCPECSFTIPVSVLIDKFKREAAPLKRAERQFTLFGFSLLGLFGVIAFINGNVLTIIGALILSLTLFFKALFYRYRHWQAETGQLFMENAPVMQWLKHEFAPRPNK
jgi:hypothetical protein